jgi:GH25 family lysozyme M1 (1,4-beta-N-acetylmuramidase)
VTVQTKFRDWSTSGLDWNKAPYESMSPNLLVLRDYLIERWGGQYLGGEADRPVIGGATISDHAYGAALDWRYQSPGPGRAFMLATILPWLIANSAELGIQSIHDYAFVPGGRIWRPPGTSGRPIDGNGWKGQNGSGQMGEPGNLWLHISVHPDAFSDKRPIPDKLGVVTPPPTKPIPDFVPVIDVAGYQFPGFTQTPGAANMPTEQPIVMTLPDPVHPEVEHAKELGVLGVLARAVNGEAVDPSYRLVAEACAWHQVRFAPYGYLRPDRITARAAAHTLLAHVDQFNEPTLPAMADCETFTGEALWSPRQYADYLHEWLETVEAGLGVKPIIYTGDWWWNVHLAHLGIEFAGYDFMLSDYVKGTVPVPAKWAEWAFGLRNGPDAASGVPTWAGWQFTSSAPAVEYGFSGNLDCNLVKQSVWNRWTAPPPTVPPTPTPAPDRSYTVNTANLAEITEGNRSEDARRMQGLINTFEVRNGRPAPFAPGSKHGPMDGHAGPATIAVLRTTQARLGLTVDGECGPNTWQALLDA